MQPVVTLWIRRHDLFDTSQHSLPIIVRLLVGLFHLARHHLLVQPHRQRIDFHKLHAIGIVHVQRGRQLLGDISKQGSIHPPVHFVQHQHVRLLQDRNLLADLRPLIFAGL